MVSFLEMCQYYMLVKNTGDKTDGQKVLAYPISLMTIDECNQTRLSLLKL